MSVKAKISLKWKGTEKKQNWCKLSPCKSNQCANFQLKMKIQERKQVVLKITKIRAQ